MTSAPPPSNEAARLRALQHFEILDTPPELAFDELTRLAAAICQTPTAVVSLVDANRQWFKARCAFGLAETPRDLAFCAFTILQSDVFEVSDATKDPRFADNPLVTGEPNIRSYAGAPIVTPGGVALGAIAVIDYVPRHLDDQQKASLRALSHQIVTLLELRRRLAEEHQVLRRNAETALANVESEKTTLFEASLDCGITFDHRGVILEFNRAAETTFGHTRADAIGRELAELILPTLLRERHREELARYLATGDHTMLKRPIETTALRADGTMIPVELTIARLGHSEPPRFTGFIRDISTRRQGELALREGLERFELVARATNDAVWDWDLRTNTVWWNQGFQSLFGYKLDEIEPSLESWTGRIHPGDLERVKRGIFAVIGEGGTSWADEYRFRRADGSYADIFGRGYVIRERDATPVRMIGAMMDITERKLARELVRQSEERYRQLVEDIPDAIFTLSADGIIASVNRGAETLLGRPREGWIGKPFPPLVEEPDRPLAMELIRRVLGGERPPTFELRLVTSAGTRITIELTLTPRWSGDRTVGALGVGRDVTERKRLEEQLRQSQKMEAIGQLSGGIAHDFNNLLTVIQCNAILIANAVNLENKQRADDIMHAAERAASLTRQLLLVSRKQVMQPTTLDLNDIVRNMTRMLQRVLGEHIELRSTYATNLPLLHADAGMLEQVLLNLVVNARDAMPRGGRLTIATGTRIVDEAERMRRPEATVGTCVWLSVGDTGSGIAPDVLPHVFEPFFTTKEVGKGTGLGLATVYGIVKQHGGWIVISSEVGNGTTFEVRLPVTELVRTSAARLAVTTERSFAGTETILVVEDEPTLRVLVVNLLERHGYTVMQAISGVAAVEVWRQHRDRIDLVLTDLVMPDGMTGRELAERLRHDNPQLKVIYSSGYSADISSSGEPLVEGVNFLQKPYLPSRLAQIVREHLDRR